MKDVKKLLKQQSRDILPDDSVKENIRKSLWPDNGAERRAATAHGGSIALGKTSKIAIAAAVIVVVMTLCIALPVALSGNDSPIVPDPPTIAFNGDFYAYSAIAVGAMLSDGTSSALALALSPSEMQEIENTTREYLRLVEGLLSEDAISHTQAQVPERLSDYQYAMSVKSRGIDGDVVTFLLCYNENIASSSQDNNEIETDFDIEGVLVTPNGDFKVYGGRQSEQENDGGETEREQELWFIAYTGENSYIRIDQEAEEETEHDSVETERTHRISVYQNGRCVESTTIDLEQEDNETEVKLSIERNGRRDSLEFTVRERGGVKVMAVQADFGSDNAEFLIYIEDGDYRFDFSAVDDDDHDD